MNRGKSRLRLSGILLGVAGIIFCGLGLQYVEGKGDALDQNPPGQVRTDIITIDTMKAFGNLERPEVVFLHDAHVDALDKLKKDCATCHLTQNDRLSPKFKRLEDTSKKDLTDLYHENCLGCHKEMNAANQKTGPVEECGHCHTTEQRFISSRQPMGFDKSLHFRHSKAQEDKCERCHHEYDEKKKALIYIKDQEGTCRYCHAQQTVDNRISMRLASHLSCIGCHQKTLAQKHSAGPFQCAGCHDPEKQKIIQKITPVPRMARKQPDKVYIKKDKKNPYLTLDTYLDPKMARVPFDHKRHEDATNTCYICHHANLSSCNSCHTLAGSKEGDHVKLEQAMHQVNTDHSCIGCHMKQQKIPECYGCHIFLPASRPQKESDCVKCHKGPAPEKVLSEPVMFDKPAGILVAGARFTDEDIPEKAIIKALTHTYEPVELPHRKIVRAIEQKIKNSTLAGSFHGQKETLCQGCHHNSPAGLKPPRCGSCHGMAFDEKDLFKPGLMAAYHGQCMGCHSQMKIEKPLNTDCIGCHTEKKS